MCMFTQFRAKAVNCKEMPEYEIKQNWKFKNVFQMPVSQETCKWSLSLLTILVFK